MTNSNRTSAHDVAEMLLEIRKPTQRSERGAVLWEKAAEAYLDLSQGERALVWVVCLELLARYPPLRPSEFSAVPESLWVLTCRKQLHWLMKTLNAHEERASVLRMTGESRAMGPLPPRRPFEDARPEAPPPPPPPAIRRPTTALPLMRHRPPPSESPSSFSATSGDLSTTRSSSTIASSSGINDPVLDNEEEEEEVMAEGAMEIAEIAPEVEAEEVEGEEEASVTNHGTESIITDASEDQRDSEYDFESEDRASAASAVEEEEEAPPQIQEPDAEQVAEEQVEIPPARVEEEPAMAIAEPVAGPSLPSPSQPPPPPAPLVQVPVDTSPRNRYRNTAWIELVPDNRDPTIRQEQANRMSMMLGFCERRARLEGIQMGLGQIFYGFKALPIRQNNGSWMYASSENKTVWYVNEAVLVTLLTPNPRPDGPILATLNQTKALIHTQKRCPASLFVLLFEKRNAANSAYIGKAYNSLPPDIRRTFQNPVIPFKPWNFYTNGDANTSLSFFPDEPDLSARLADVLSAFYPDFESQRVHMSNEWAHTRQRTFNDQATPIAPIL